MDLLGDHVLGLLDGAVVGDLGHGGPGDGGGEGVALGLDGEVAHRFGEERAAVADAGDAGGEAVIESVGPYISGPRRLAGFWILEAPDAETAREWAIEASAACDEPVELRPFH